MKTSHKILIAYAASSFVFYTTVGILNVSRVRETLPLGENICRQFDATPVRVADLLAASGYDARRGDERRNLLRLAVAPEPGTLTFRGDTLVVCGEGEIRAGFGKRDLSQISIPTLTTLIDTAGVHTFLPDGTKEPATPLQDTLGAVAPEPVLSAPGRPNP